MERKRQIALLILLAGFTTMAEVIARDDDRHATDTMKVEAVSKYVAQHEDVIVLDVRTPVEYGISHIPGAVNINVQDESFADLAAKLETDKTYIVYCTRNPVGGRSMTALAKLEELGFKGLYSLEGGHVAWKKAELPMSTPQEN